ncbi:MAG: SGNH/GDSL hydrolase family protein [Candidatus Omnitrophota bacterium]
MRNKIILLCCGCLLFLALAEIGVRVFRLAPPVVENLGAYRLVDNPKMVYGLQPGARLDESLINAQGFKDQDFIKQKPKNTLRIAMLGDSITEGMRIPLGQTFSDLLEAALNEQALRRKSPRRYDVMNFGVGGYNLEAEIELLKTTALAYRPDVVILNLAPNDNEPVPGLFMWFLAENGLSPKEKARIFSAYFSPRPSWQRLFVRKFLLKSKLYLLLLDRLSRLNVQARRLRRLEKYHLGQSTDVQMWGREGFQRQLKELARLQKVQGFELLVCLHDFFGPTKARHPNLAAAAAMLEDSGIRYFFIKDFYLDRVSSLQELVLIPGDYCHLNALGHRLAAQGLSSELAKHRDEIFPLRCRNCFQS